MSSLHAVSRGKRWRWRFQIVGVTLARLEFGEKACADGVGIVRRWGANVGADFLKGNFRARKAALQSNAVSIAGGSNVRIA